MVSRAWFVAATYLIIAIVILIIIGGAFIDHLAYEKKRARRDADRYLTWYTDQAETLDLEKLVRESDQIEVNLAFDRLAAFQHMTILQFARYRLDFKVQALGHRLVRQHKEP